MVSKTDFFIRTLHVKVKSSIYDKVKWDTNQTKHILLRASTVFSGVLVEAMFCILLVEGVFFKTRQQISAVTHSMLVE